MVYSVLWFISASMQCTSVWDEPAGFVWSSWLMTYHCLTSSCGVPLHSICSRRQI